MADDEKILSTRQETQRYEISRTTELRDHDQMVDAVLSTERDLVEILRGEVMQKHGTGVESLEVRWTCTVVAYTPPVPLKVDLHPGAGPGVR